MEAGSIIPGQTAGTLVHDFFDNHVIHLPTPLQDIIIDYVTPRLFTNHIAFIKELNDWLSTVQVNKHCKVIPPFYLSRERQLELSNQIKRLFDDVKGEGVLSLMVDLDFIDQIVDEKFNKEIRIIVEDKPGADFAYLHNFCSLQTKPDFDRSELTYVDIWKRKEILNMAYCGYNTLNPGSIVSQSMFRTTFWVTKIFKSCCQLTFVRNFAFFPITEENLSRLADDAKGRYVEVLILSSGGYIVNNPRVLAGEDPNDMPFKTMRKSATWRF